MSLVAPSTRAFSLSALRAVLQRSTLQALNSLNASAARRLAIVIGAVHLLASIVAYASHLMLQADGSFFVYALSVGEPWALRWQDVPTRVTAYLTTALPTSLVASRLHLSPMEIGDINGLIFYLVPTLQFCFASLLVWRSEPKLLLFPAAQYALFTAQGYGFPSEILIAPGFLWLALFLVHTGRTYTIWFFLCFLALLFTHELAIPSAIVVAYLAVISSKSRVHPDNAIKWLLLFFALAFALWFYIRFSGSTSADSNAIYVLDPRRIVNNPTLWVITAALLIAVFCIRFSTHSWISIGLALLIGVSPFILQILFPEINFEQGRYDSARTIIGAGMLFLALLFAAKPHRQVADKNRKSWRAGINISVYGSLFACIASSALFVVEWKFALKGAAGVVRAPSISSVPEWVSYEEALKAMTQEEARTNQRMGYAWVMPFRSAVIADGQIPGRLIQGPHHQISFACFPDRQILMDGSRIPQIVSARIHEFACQPREAIKTNNLRTRAGAWLRSFWARIRGENP